MNTTGYLIVSLILCGVIWIQGGFAGHSIQNRKYANAGGAIALAALLLVLLFSIQFEQRVRSILDDIKIEQTTINKGNA